MPELLVELAMAREANTYFKTIQKHAKPALLIIDEWLLLKPTEAEQKDIFELLHQRRKRSSAIFCSQFDPQGWYEQLGGEASPLADAILDRIIHDGYKIAIVPKDPAKSRSMRGLYGLPKELRE